MVFAITVAIITFIVIIAGIVAFLIIRARRSGTSAKPHAHGRDVVKSIDSVGVSSSLMRGEKASDRKKGNPRFLSGRKPR